MRSIAIKEKGASDKEGYWDKLGKKGFVASIGCGEESESKEVLKEIKRGRPTRNFIRNPYSHKKSQLMKNKI